MKKEPSAVIKFKKKILQQNERVINYESTTLESVFEIDGKMEIKSDAGCFLIVTDCRIVFFKSKLFGDCYVELPYSKISSIQYSALKDETIVNINMLNLDRGYKFAVSNKKIITDFETAIEQSSCKFQINKGTSFEKLVSFKKK